MERDLQTIKSLLQNLAGQRQASSRPARPWTRSPTRPSTVSNERSKGNSGAKVTLVEVSDYHCPFCRRQTLQTLPEVMKEYVNSGKARYVFVDYPIAQLHPDAFKSHEAANCAGDQGKYWQMHESLFANAPVKGRRAAHRAGQDDWTRRRRSSAPA